jgi:hypothetical protein
MVVFYKTTMSDIGRTSQRARRFALMGGAAQLALLCSLGLTAMVRNFQRPMWKCMHGKRTIAFVLVTDESSTELVKCLGLDEIAGIENYWCHVAPIGVVAKYGNLDSLDTAIDKAWDYAGKRRNPEYVRQTKRSDPYVERRVKHGVGRASIEMRIEARGICGSLRRTRITHKLSVIIGALRTGNLVLISRSGSIRRSITAAASG